MTGSSRAVVAPAKPPLKAGGSVGAIVPQDAEQAWRMAEMIAKSGLAPRDMKSPEQIVTAIFHGLEIGLKPMQAVQSIAVVNGRPTVWGDAALGLVESSGLLEDFAESVDGDGDKMVAKCFAKRIGRATPIERTFSVDDAKAAGLWGKAGPWQQYKRRMLQLRARAFTLRDGFADVLKGLQITEEARDYNLAEQPASHTSRITAADVLAQGGALPPPVDVVDVPSVADPVPPEPEKKGMKVAVPLDEETGEVDWSRWQAVVLRGVLKAPNVDTLNEWWAAQAAALATFAASYPAQAASMQDTVNLRMAEFAGATGAK